MAVSICLCLFLSVSGGLFLSLSVSAGLGLVCPWRSVYVPIGLCLSLSVSAGLYLSLSVFCGLSLSLSVFFCPCRSLVVFVYLCCQQCWSFSVPIRLCRSFSVSAGLWLTLSAICIWRFLLRVYLCWYLSVMFVETCAIDRVIVTMLNCQSIGGAPENSGQSIGLTDVEPIICHYGPIWPMGWLRNQLQNVKQLRLASDNYVHCTW